MSSRFFLYLPLKYLLLILFNLMEDELTILEQISFTPNKNLNLLDLGCGDCSFLFEFYNNYNGTFNEIHAVDSGKDYNKTEGLVSNQDLFQRYNGNCNLEEKKILTQNVMFYYEDEVTTFLDQVNTSYDIIIMRNLLHCLESKETAISIINKTIKHLSENGFLYILIATPSFANKKKETEFGPRWGATIKDLTDWCIPLKTIYNETIENNWNQLLLKKTNY